MRGRRKMSCKMVRGYGKYFDGITEWYGIGFWRGRQKRFLVAQELVKVGPMNMVVWGLGLLFMRAVQ
jgi:hypothetical protein